MNNKRLFNYIMSYTLLLLILPFFLFLDQPPTIKADGSFNFTEVTESVLGTIPLHHSKEIFDEELYLITGQAWGDVNGDGWDDLYLTDTYGPNSLYINQQNGQFTLSTNNDDVALTSSWSGGALFADYDNDGWQDLYVTSYGDNYLFHNDAGTGFTDVTNIANVTDIGKGETAAWGDYDQDGYLDLYVTNWTCLPECDPYDRSLQQDHLYHNNGDGTFTDVTTYTLTITKTEGAGFAVSFVDYDNDHDLDIYVVNDRFNNPIGNVLWRNDGPGCNHWCFTDVSESSGANIVLYGMGLAVGDYDHDQDLDFYFSNMGDPAVLLQNQGDGTFIEAQETAGVEWGAEIGWGTFFFDYDNDGWSDLYLSNMTMTFPPNSPNQLFKNNGDGTFTNVSSSSGANDQRRSIGSAYADYDQDGLVDLIVGNFNVGYALYQNQTVISPTNNWIGFDLVGGGTINRNAIGARIYLTTTTGIVQMQALKTGSSLGSGNSLKLHFGLGTGTVETAVVLWPDGSSQTVPNLNINQYNTVKYPAYKIFFPFIPSN